MLPLREAIRPTTLIESPRLSARLGARTLIISETFQLTGSFKFRAAYNVALHVPHTHIIAASAGNFGQSLAYACRLAGKRCTVVMPHDSAQVKIEAVREYGARVELIDVRAISREERVQQLAREFPGAYVASAYDDPLVIEGNASLVDELLTLGCQFDRIIIPVGGGGLLAGAGGRFAAEAQKPEERKVEVFGAEPLLGNDAARSLREGRLFVNESEPQTIADGARTLSLGAHNWTIIREHVAGIVEVGEDHIKEGVRLLYSLANLKAEPTGTLAVGALLACPELFRDREVCCVVTGGNVDAAIYQELIR